MQELKFFLEKYRKFAPPDDMVRGEFIRIVERLCGVVLSRDVVSLRNGVLFVKASPALKSELYIRSVSIMAELDEALGKKCPQKIR